MNPLARIPTALGTLVLQRLHTQRAMGILFAKAWIGVLGRRYPRGAAAMQMYELGNRSFLFVAVTLGFLGMVMVMQSGLQIERITGDLTPLGPQFFKLFVQELGPTITALMIATRAGAGIAAEIGSMQVTEQIDALRLSGITPISYLVSPRLLACVVMTVVLTTFAIGISFGAGGLTAYRVFELNPTAFFDASQVRFYDVAMGLTKAVCYGMAIPIVSAHHGLAAQGGSQGVGNATTAAVIGSSFGILLIDFFLSGIGFAFFGGGMS